MRHRQHPTKVFFKCPTCGKSGIHRSFTLGALGIAPQTLTQTFVGHQRGDNNGGLKWTRRPMKREELEHIGRALATATNQVAKMLDENELPVIDPEAALAAIDSDEELTEVCNAWMEEVEKELEFRKRIIAAELQRRGGR